MTKHSSRLILKISYFIISISELVLRNKIRFVARVHNVDNCTVALLAIVSQFPFFGSLALLAIHLLLFFQMSGLI